MSVLDRFRLDGKRAMVTGGSRGLGREMSLALASAGADVVIIGRDQESLDQTCREIAAMGRQADHLQGDVGDSNQCESICRSVLEQFGPIQILINNVGGRRENIPTEEMPLEKWRELIDLNLTSTFVCTKEIGGSMIRSGEGGRIINIASINALVAGRQIRGRHYETAKGAMVQFTKATAVDWAEHGITVNAILPGGFMTEANQRWAKIHPEVITAFQSQIPMGKYGTPEDLGPLAVYLASEASRYMTGATSTLR